MIDNRVPTVVINRIQLQFRIQSKSCNLPHHLSEPPLNQTPEKFSLPMYRNETVEFFLNGAKLSLKGI